MRQTASIVRWAAALVTPSDYRTAARVRNSRRASGRVLGG
jgi:hypothetical protein